MKKKLFFLTIISILLLNDIVYAFSYSSTNYSYTNSDSITNTLDYILDNDMFKYKVGNVTSVNNVGPTSYPYSISSVTFTPSSNYDFYIATILRFSGGTGYESMNLERTAIKDSEVKDKFEYYEVGTSSSNSSNGSSGSGRSYIIIPKTDDPITIRVVGDLDGIGVYGVSLGSETYTPVSEDLGYTPLDPSWNVNNVSGALSYIKSHNINYLKPKEETLIKKEGNVSQTSFTPESDYSFYILTAYISRTPTNYYSTLHEYLNISSITNANYYLSGDIGNNAGGSCGVAKSWVIIPTNDNQIDITFNNQFSSYTLYGIKFGKK